MRGVIVFVVLAVLQWMPWILAGPLGQPVAGIVGAVLFGVALGWAIRGAPRERRAAWGLSPRSPAGPLLAIGFAVSAATYIGVFAVRWWGSGGEAVPVVQGAEVLLVVLAGLAVAGYQAFTEEVVFRGAVFTLLPARVPVAGAVAISTTLFVLFHAPRWDALVSGPYALHLVLAGVAFALAYVRTGSLWLGIGLHAGWNLGAYVLREGEPTLVRLTGVLPEGWGGWSSWLGVAGNAILLGATLVLTSARVRRLWDAPRRAVLRD